MPASSGVRSFVAKVTSATKCLSTLKTKSNYLAFIYIAFISYSVLLIWASREIPIWIDEAATISIASKSTLEIISFCLNDSDAPHLVYYLICHIILEVFPSSLFALRCVSIVAALLSACLVYQIGSIILSKEKGIIGAIFFLISPVTFNFATQARSSILVTLVSATILLLIVNKEFISMRILFLIHILMTLNILLNFLTYIFAFICFVFLYMIQSSVKSRRSLISLFLIPTFFCIFLAFISKDKSGVLSWIADDFSPLGSLHRILLWPLVENTRDLPIILTILSGLLFIGFYTISNFQWSLLQLNSKLSLCIAIGVFPPFLLWFVSIYFPIFQTRYFSYSMIGVAILISTAFLRRSRRRFSVLLGIFLILVSALQMFHIWNGRGASFDWPTYRNELSTGPQNQTLIVDPPMFSLLIDYHTKKKIPILSVHEIQKRFNTDPVVLCSDSLVNVAYISPLESIDVDNSENEILLSLGFRPLANHVSSTDSVKRYRLLNCQ
jgi:uncharacterized membrane protein